MDGRAIRKRRLELGLTQEQVANIAHISRERISKIERDEDARVTQNTLYGLAEALQIDPAILAGRNTLVKEQTAENTTEDDNVRIDDPDIKMFFSGDWHKLTEEERNLIRQTIKVIKAKK